MKLKKFSDGFSLIELAIVLCVIGIIGGLSMPLISQQMNRSKQRVSINHHEQIIRSLAGYVLRHNKLPFAADPSAKGGALGKYSDRLTVGIVPFKTLGLDESVARDGNKNFITYVVDKNLCQVANGLIPPAKKTQVNSSNNSSMSGLGGSISSPHSSSTINAEGHYFCAIGNSPYKLITPRGEEANKAVVLISHGSGGHGAYLCNGTKSQKVASTFGVKENLNAKAISSSGVVFQKFPFSSNKENPFRHYVTAVSRDNLMAIYAQYPCRGDK